MLAVLLMRTELKT